MHPYRMREMIKQRGKDKIANVVQRNSVYQTIDRLLRAELIAVRETERDERRPERTVYEITPAGWDALRSWTREMLSTPAREYPEFPAGLATAMVLEPADVLAQLEARAEVLEAERRQALLDAVEASYLPRLFVLDDQYATAVRDAELQWVRSVIAALRAGQLTWSEESIRKLAEHLRQ